MPAIACLRLRTLTAYVLCLHLHVTVCMATATHMLTSFNLDLKLLQAVTNFGMGSIADKADELESNSSAPSLAACSVASSSHSIEHDSISHSASSAAGVLVPQHAALFGAGKHRSCSSSARSHDSHVASAPFLGAVPVHQQQRQYLHRQEERQPCTPCTVQSFDCLPSHESSQYCSGSSLHYVGWECPQLGWALPSEASSNAADFSDDPSSDENASYASFNMSEVGRSYCFDAFNYIS